MNAKADLAKLRAARNRASKAYRERLKEAGKREVRELLDAADIERLDQLAEVHGSRAKALSFLIGSAAPNRAVVWKAGDVAETVTRETIAEYHHTGPKLPVTGHLVVDLPAEAAPKARRNQRASEVRESSTPDVQVGPARVPPGSRLKAKK